MRVFASFLFIVILKRNGENQRCRTSQSPRTYNIGWALMFGSLGGHDRVFTCSVLITKIGLNDQFSMLIFCILLLEGLNERIPHRLTIDAAGLPGVQSHNEYQSRSITEKYWVFRASLPSERNALLTSIRATGSLCRELYLTLNTAA